MTQPATSDELTVEEVSSELNQADAGRLIDLASACLADDPGVLVIGPPTVGSVVTQVREPVAEQRFILADVLACRAEVSRAGERGWAMRMGSDRMAALAAAICAAEVAAAGPRTEQIRELCRRGRTRREAARAAEWERLAPSIVEFEEIP